MSISIEDAKVGALVQTQMPFTQWSPTFTANDILLIVAVNVYKSEHGNCLYIDVASNSGVVQLLVCAIDNVTPSLGWWYYLDLVQSAES